MAMGKQAKATFDMKTWDEQPYNEGEGLPKMTRVSVGNSFTGDLEGEGKLEYLLVYREDGIVSFVGLERVVGRLGERTGSFVLEHNGVFEAGVAKASLLVVPGSGTAELSGLRGAGKFPAVETEQASLILDYELD